jgi:hypothetical protein
LAPFTNDMDVLVIAAPDDANIGALPDLLDLYHPRQVLFTRATSASSNYRALRTQLNDQVIETVDAGALPVLHLGQGVKLTVVADGDQGSVLRLEWDKFSQVLAPGEDAAGEMTLKNDGPGPTDHRAGVARQVVQRTRSATSGWRLSTHAWC